MTTTERYRFDQITRQRASVLSDETELRRLTRLLVRRDSAELFQQVQRQKECLAESKRILALMERTSMFMVHNAENKIEKHMIPEEGDDSIIIAIQSPAGQQLGIQFNSDGTFTIGGWNVDGEWTVLVPRQPCSRPNCYAEGHTLPFDLTAYMNADQPQGGLF